MTIDPARDTAPVTARPAATIILVRDGIRELEVLLVERNPAARFMGGAWVFPGGAVDATEGDGEPAHRVAAVRELAEEAGITGVDPAALVPFSHWITPSERPVRFDTQFFVARAPAGAVATVDGQECVDCVWVSPQAALDAHAGGELQLVFPTIKHLEELTAFPSVDGVLAHARGRDIVTVHPHMIGSRTVLPGDADQARQGLEGAEGEA